MGEDTCLRSSTHLMTRDESDKEEAWDASNDLKLSKFSVTLTSLPSTTTDEPGPHGPLGNIVRAIADSHYGCLSCFLKIWFLDHMHLDLVEGTIQCTFQQASCNFLPVWKVRNSIDTIPAATSVRIWTLPGVFTTFGIINLTTFPLFIHYLNAHLSSPLVNHSGRSRTVTQFTSLQLQFIIELVFMDIGQMSEYINS